MATASTRRRYRRRLTLRERSSALALLAGLLAGCAPKAPALPSGAGSPFPEFASAYRDATSACSGVKTITASMGMSGKAGNTKLRGRIDAGFAAPARARLEGVPPLFGKPVFVLVADGGSATLVLTRDDRVLRDAAPDQIVEALAGVALGPDALRTAVAGCGFGGTPSNGRVFPNGWVATSSDDTTTYLRPQGSRWEIAAAERGAITILYADYTNGRPLTIRVRGTSAGRTTADLTLRLSDVDINTTLDPRTFDITSDLPQHPIPLTLDELRRAGPMGGASP